MHSTPLRYDTFEALKSDTSLPLAASPELLIRSIAFSLIKIRTVISTQGDLSIIETAKLSNHDDPYLMLPREAIAETISKFLSILRRFERSVLNPTLFLKALCQVHQRHTAWSSTSSMNGKVHSRSILSRNDKFQKTLDHLSRNLNRVRSQLESLVYWTDNVLLANLATFARGESSRKKLFTADYAQSDEKFNMLINDCVDVTQAGWLMITQLTQAETMMVAPFRPIGNSRVLSSCGSCASFSTSNFKFSLDASRNRTGFAGQRLQYRSTKKFRPKSGAYYNRVITQLIISLDPQSSLRAIRAAKHFLLM